MHPLAGAITLAVIAVLGMFAVAALPAVSSWRRRRELELLVLAAPLGALAVSLAGLRYGTASMCLLGPLPLDHRINIGVAVVMSGSMVLALAGGIARVVVLHMSVTRRGEAATPALRRCLAQLAGRLGVTPPRVRLLARDQPLAVTYGVASPTVLLSTWMVEHLDEHELSAVLAHELGHVARRDYLLAWLAAVLRDAFWFLPSSRLAYRRLKEDKEPACDDLAVRATGRPLALASALAKVWRQAAMGATVSTAQTLTATHVTVEERIARLLAGPPPTERVPGGHRRVVGFGALALSAMIALDLASAAALVVRTGCGSGIPIEKLL